MPKYKYLRSLIDHDRNPLLTVGDYVTAIGGCWWVRSIMAPPELVTRVCRYPIEIHLEQLPEAVADAKYRPLPVRVDWEPVYHFCVATSLKQDMSDLQEAGLLHG